MKMRKVLGKDGHYHLVPDNRKKKGGHKASGKATKKATKKKGGRKASGAIASRGKPVKSAGKLGKGSTAQQVTTLNRVVASLDKRQTATEKTVAHHTVELKDHKKMIHAMGGILKARFGKAVPGLK